MFAQSRSAARVAVAAVLSAAVLVALGAPALASPGEGPTRADLAELDRKTPPNRIIILPRPPMGPLAHDSFEVQQAVAHAATRLGVPAASIQVVSAERTLLDAGEVLRCAKGRRGNAPTVMVPAALVVVEHARALPRRGPTDAFAVFTVREMRYVEGHLCGEKTRKGVIRPI
jgi:hypothetical protein